MNRPRIVIAGVSSGAGKTTVTLGLLAALRRRGLKVQGFKVGPDYIDPGHHSVVTGRPSRNLDTWMMSPDAMREVFDRGSEGADISVIEGVMGMYDGKDPLSDRGSSAEVSALLAAGVVLVVDVSSMARSAAAVVLGFQELGRRAGRQSPISAVIVNRAGSKGHYELVKAAVEQVCAVPVVGYLPRSDSLRIPERHLGLVTAAERGEAGGDLFTALADALEATVDVERVARIAREGPGWTAPAPTLFVGRKRPPTVTVAVARDRAFNFYYPENLELLEWHGATIVEFRPLEDEPVPDVADGVYIGGGFPEEFGSLLSVRTAALDSLRRAAQQGMPIVAECGGLMLLARELTDRAGETHPMAGIVPARVTMQPRLAGLGYREVTARRDTALLRAGESARGHEFHYSTAVYDDAQAVPSAYDSVGLRGAGVEGYAAGNVVASYTHLHFASNPAMVERFIAACAAFRGAQAAVPDENRDRRGAVLQEEGKQ